MKVDLSTFIAVFFVAGLSIAGEWHVGETLTCQDCHLQHSSLEGAPVGGGPFSALLLKDSINELCLSCHDGSDSRAPDVYYPVTMYTHGAAAGFFSAVQVDNPNGHNLGFAGFTPFDAERRSIELNCATCHAVHGNDNYRNLARDPAANGESIDLFKGIHVFPKYSPSIPPTIQGTVQTYDRRNVGYKQGYSAWCTSCHNRLGPAQRTEAPVAHHPSTGAIGSTVTEDTVDLQHWLAGKGSGFLESNGSSPNKTERLRFEMPEAVDHQSALVVASSNRIFCGTCHHAHGSRNIGNLVWNYLGVGESGNAGCQQCHNK